MDNPNNLNNTENNQEENPEVKTAWSFFAKARNNFITGILVLMPIVLTLWIFKTLIFTMDKFLSSFIPLEYIQKLTYRYDSPFFQYLTGETTIPGMGLLFGSVIVIFVGMFAKNVIGRRLFSFSDRAIANMPIISSIYSAIKQIIDTIGSSKSASFREVVLVEYPRKDCWVVAFVSGSTAKGLQNVITEEDEEMLNVFVPTTPNPTSGFLIFIPRKDVKKLNISVEDGIKLVVSAGIVTPRTLVRNIKHKATKSK